MISRTSILSTLTHFQWRNTCRQAVYSYWSDRLREEASDKPTLSNCNLMNMAIGKSHLIWENVDNNTVDVKRGITKARMLTGVYMLQSTKAGFNQYDVEQICLLCMLATEDLQHMLTRCLALSEVRSPLLSSIRVLLSRRFGVTWWSSRSSAQIVALCLDSSNINDQINHSVEGSFLCRLETLGRRLCHKLHMKRLQLYQKIFQ